MINKEKRILYGNCLLKWNETSQIDMCIEEMAELTQALCKAKRHKKPIQWLQNIYDEIADVTIMLEQITIIFDGETAVPNCISKKTERLQKRVDK